ncbi:hypothetical protein M432DRAFT_426527 [Thermoascus aurantiacus ATCC 26904]
MTRKAKKEERNTNRGLSQATDNTQNVIQKAPSQETSTNEKVGTQDQVAKPPCEKTTTNEKDDMVKRAELMARMKVSLHAFHAAYEKKRLEPHPAKAESKETESDIFSSSEYTSETTSSTTSWHPPEKVNPLADGDQDRSTAHIAKERVDHAQNHDCEKVDIGKSVNTVHPDAAKAEMTEISIPACPSITPFQLPTVKSSQARMLQSKTALCEDTVGEDRADDSSSQRSHVATCPACKAGFSNVSALHAHQVSKKHCYCAYCKGFFLGPKDLSEHFKSIHKIACQTCGQPAETLVALRVHQKLSGHCYCPDCRCFFSHPDDLQEHNSSIHTKICDTCGKTFKTRDSLSQHQTHCSAGKATLKPAEKQTENQVSETMPTCPFCKITFASVFKLREHQKLRKHEYSCKYCVKTFATQQGVDQHNSALGKHGRAKKGEYSCKLCDRAFTTEQGLNAHRNDVHVKAKTKGTRR